MSPQEKALQDRLIRTITLTNLLVSELDELEQLKLYRHKLKHTGKQFKRELEKKIDEVWKSGNEKSESQMSGNTDRMALVEEAFNESVNLIL